MNYLMVILTHKFADRYICDDSIIAASFVEKGSQTEKSAEMTAFSLSFSELGKFQLMLRVYLTHFNVYLYAHPYLPVFSL